MTPALDIDAKRKRLIAAVHAEAKRAGIDEDTYRALLKRVTTLDSAKGLTIGQLGAVLDEIKRSQGSGIRGQAKGAPGSGTGTPRAGLAGGGARRAIKPADSDHARKIRALWLSLWQLGAVGDPGEAAIAAFARRQCHVDAVQFVTPSEAAKVIEALKAWCIRIGYDPKPYPKVPDQPAYGRFEPYLIEAQWERLIAAGVFRFGQHAGLGSWISKNFKVSHQCWLDERQLRAAVERLGQWIRRVYKPEEAGSGGG